MGDLARLLSFEHGRGQVSLLVPAHRGRGRCETLRYGPVGSTGYQGLVDGFMVWVGADGAGPGMQCLLGVSAVSSVYIKYNGDHRHH